jgi:hypothetical protein
MAACARHNKSLTQASPGAFASKSFRSKKVDVVSDTGQAAAAAKDAEGELKASEFVSLARYLLPPPSRTPLGPSLTQTEEGGCGLWWDLWHKQDATYAVPKVLEEGV